MLLHSPEETATTSVEPTVLTAPVESRLVRSEVTGTGTVTASGTVALAVTPPDGMTALVTDTPLPAGADVPWCRPLVEVSGRPVIALRGALPAFRDLTVGDQGEDVRRLQGALRECGYAVAADGEFGALTATAVTALYRAVGHSVVTSAGAGLGGGAVGEADLSETGASSEAARVSLTIGMGSGEQPVEIVPTPDPITDPEPVDDPEPIDDDPTPDRGVVPEPADIDERPRGDDPSPTPSGAAPQVVVPRGEVAFLPAVGTLARYAALGSDPGSEPVATVALTGTSLAVSLTATQRAFVAEGSAVTITGEGWATTTTLPALTDTTTPDENGMPAYQASILLGDDVPSDAVGGEASFVVLVGSTEPYDRVVPVSALFQDTDGTTFLRRVDGDLLTRIAVEVVAAAGGYSAVEVLGTGDLAAGDEVVIGE